MKYIDPQHKKIYNILKKEKDAYNYTELFKLIKTSGIKFHSDVTHKKTLEYYLINEAPYSLLVKLKEDKILALIDSTLSIQNNLEDKNIKRIKFLKENDIASISGYPFIKKLFEGDVQKEIISLFQDGTVKSFHLEIDQHNYNLWHYYSPLDSLEKIKIIEQCGHIFQVKDFYYLSQYMSSAECQKIIDYFSKKIDFNSTFLFSSLVNFENYNDEKIGVNMNTNITSLFLIKNKKHPFFSSLLKNKIYPYFNEDIYEYNFIEFKETTDFLIENPNFIFDKDKNVSSLSIMLSQINNPFLKEHLYLNLSIFIQLIDTSKLENALGLKTLIDHNSEVLRLLFSPNSAKASIYRILNAEEDKKQIKILQDKILEIFNKHQEIFDDFSTFSFNNKNIKDNKMLKDFFYKGKNLFTHTHSPYYFLKDKSINFENFILSSNSSIEDKITFLFNCSNIDYDMILPHINTSKNEILDKIKDSIYQFYSQKNIDVIDYINNFQISNGPEKWRFPEDSIRLLDLKHSLISNNKFEIHQGAKKRL